MTKGAKVALGIVIGLVVVIGGGIYINDKIEEDELRRARAQLELTEREREHEAEMQRLNVRYVELTTGPVAAHHLELCYMEGFPTEGIGSPPDSMSRRERAQCQAIMDAMHKAKAQQEAAKRRADAAYDKAHPVK